MNGLQSTSLIAGSIWMICGRKAITGTRLMLKALAEGASYTSCVEAVQLAKGLGASCKAASLASSDKPEAVSAAGRHARQCEHSKTSS